MASTTLNVPDISCEHCERTIIDTLTLAAGIEQVSVDIPAKEVHVTYDERRIDVERMKQLLEDEDYPVVSAT